MYLIFKLKNTQTEYGHIVYLVGNIEELGAWNVSLLDKLSNLGGKSNRNEN
jgi:hypothetical protein